MEIYDRYGKLETVIALFYARKARDDGSMTFPLSGGGKLNLTKLDLVTIVESAMQCFAAQIIFRERLRDAARLRTEDLRSERDDDQV